MRFHTYHTYDLCSSLVSQAPPPPSSKSHHSKNHALHNCPFYAPAMFNIKKPFQRLRYTRHGVLVGDMIHIFHLYFPRINHLYFPRILSGTHFRPSQPRSQHYGPVFLFFLSAGTLYKKEANSYAL